MITVSDVGSTPLYLYMTFFWARKNDPCMAPCQADPLGCQMCSDVLKSWGVGDLNTTNASLDGNDGIRSNWTPFGSVFGISAIISAIEAWWSSWRTVCRYLPIDPLNVWPVATRAQARLWCLYLASKDSNMIPQKDDRMNQWRWRNLLQSVLHWLNNPLTSPPSSREARQDESSPSLRAGRAGKSLQSLAV